MFRTVSQKLKNKKSKEEENDGEESSGISVSCLSLYGRAGNCKVGADTGDELSSSRRRSSSVNDESRFGCFARERFWRKNTRKEQSLEESVLHSRLHIFLPDEILELCLLRLPFETLIAARLVCKKWCHLTTSPRFIQMRLDRQNDSTWLFLIVSGDIHALDIARGRWHKIDSEVLKSRSMFSVASTRDEVIVIGGNSGHNRAVPKTHKGVIAFCPLSNTWRKLPSMKQARSAPIVSVSGTVPTSKRLGESKFAKRFKGKKFVILVIGGLGSWDEHLQTGEIYDSSTNKWSELPKLPSDTGVICCGVMCGTVFYVYSEGDKLMGYDLRRGDWKGVETAPLPSLVREYCPKLVCCEGRVMMACVSWCEGEGQIGHRNKAVRKMWQLDFGCGTWSEVSVHPDAPMDWNAAFLSERNMVFGVETFRIFGKVLCFLTVGHVSCDGMAWRHVESSRMVQQFDGSCSVMKSMAVLDL